MQDFDEAFNQVIMNPGQTESEVTLGVSDDGLPEGVEYVEIFFEYVNGCGELVVTSSRVAILDPIPVEAHHRPRMLERRWNAELGLQLHFWIWTVHLRMGRRQPSVQPYHSILDLRTEFGQHLST